MPNFAIDDYVPIEQSSGSDNSVVAPAGNVAANPMAADPATQQANTSNNNANYESTINALVNANSTGAPDIIGAGAPDAAATQPLAADQKSASLKEISATQDYLNSVKRWMGGLYDGMSDPKKMSNPLAMMGLMGVGAAQKNSYEREKAATAQQYALDSQNNAAAIARGIVDRNSAAITAAPRTTGIINHALTRLNGQQVFTPNGRVI